MTGEEIKEECEYLYSQIKSANERLDELRKICTHENTFEGNWSWRVGTFDPAIICGNCGKLLAYKNTLKN